MTSDAIETEDERSSRLDSDYQYRCPVCGAIYQNEILARVHISLSDDEPHKNQNGFMPENYIEIINDEEEIIGQVEGNPDEINTNTLDINDFHEELNERKRCVLLIAATNWQFESYQKLYERACEALEARNLETVSYDTVRRWVQDYYTPQQYDGRILGSIDETFNDLTTLQQAVVIHHLADPDASYATIADRAGCSKAYPTSVYNRAGELIDQLQSELESGASFDDVLGTLTEESLANLRAEGCLSDLPVDVDIPTEPHEAGGERNGGTETYDGPATGPLSQSLTTNPPDPFGENDDYDSWGTEPSNIVGESADTGAATPNETTSGERTRESGTNTGLGITAGNPDEIPGMVPAADVQALIANVRFLRRVYKRELNSSESETARINLALIKEIEAELEALIKE